jgi:hypothetical protein
MIMKRRLTKFASLNAASVGIAGVSVLYFVVENI